MGNLVKTMHTVLDAQLEEQREAAAEWVPTDSLRAWENNPRKNDKAVGELAKSIKRFGFGAPIVARKANGEIIAGHTRWAAAKKLKLDRVPVRFMDLDPAEAHVLALADNKLGEIADWDDGLLTAVLADLRVHDADLLSGTGFDQSEIDKLLASTDTIGEDGGSELGSDLKYSVVIECSDERDQSMLLDRFEAEGLRCRPIIS